MSIIICEKPSQARNIRAAIGSKYGTVYSAIGHLLRFELPQETNPAWKVWGFDVLAPDGRRFNYKPSTGGGKDDALKSIGKALKKTDHVIIATDCDREGEGIGREILLYFGFTGKVSRAMFSAEDTVSLTKAFDNLEPSSKYDNLYEAFYARAASDQIANLSLTRAATKAFIPDGIKATIGIGRVKTPTLGIICKRELDIINFKPRTFFEISMTIQSDNATATLWHRPRGENRVFSKDIAATLQAAASSWSGKIGVDRKTKNQKPPKLLDLPSLQKIGSKWGWSAKKTLEIAQTLYATHKITTYPRAETKFLPETQITDAPLILDMLLQLDSFRSESVFSDMIEENGVKTRAIHFSDKGLKGAAHHAIIPNVNIADTLHKIIPNLSDDEAQLFDYIARSYLAAISPDHIYDEAILHTDIPADDRLFPFKLTGRMTKFEGWKVIIKPTADNDDNQDKIDTQLSPIEDGAAVSATESAIDTKETKPPSRYTEGTLIDAMQNAHRFIDDEKEKDRLKEAKGIGTPATRDTIIEGLKKQGFVALKAKSITPTANGMGIYSKILDVAPSLVDAGVTAQLEFRLDAVQSGEIDADIVIADTITNTALLIKQLRKAKPLNVTQKPSKKTRDFVESLARNLKLTPPAGYKSCVLKCRTFINQNYTKSETDKNGPASDKQMAWVEKLVLDGKPEPKGYPDQVTIAIASKFLDRHFKKRKTKK